MLYKAQRKYIGSTKSKMDILKNSIDVELIYNNRKQEIDKILNEKDYDGLLRIYNRKSLHERVSGIFNLSSKEYPNLVLRLLKSDKKEW